MSLHVSPFQERYVNKDLAPAGNGIKDCNSQCGWAAFGIMWKTRHGGLPWPPLRKKSLPSLPARFVFGVLPDREAMVKTVISMTWEAKYQKEPHLFNRFGGDEATNPRIQIEYVNMSGGRRQTYA